MAADGLCQGWWWRRRVVGVVGAGGGGWSVSGVLSPANLLHHTLTGQMASPASFATALTMALTIASGNDPATRKGRQSLNLLNNFPAVESLEAPTL